MVNIFLLIFHLLKQRYAKNVVPVGKTNKPATSGLRFYY